VAGSQVIAIYVHPEGYGPGEHEHGGKYGGGKYGGGTTGVTPVDAADRALFPTSLTAIILK
jgi:hypothetical protein